MPEYSNIWVYGKKKKKVGKVVLKPDALEWTSSKGTSAPITIPVGEMQGMEWCQLANGFELKVAMSGGGSVRFQGFQESTFGDFETLIKEAGKEMTVSEVSTLGWNWGGFEFKGSNMLFNVANKPAFELPLGNIAQSVVQGKNEVSLEMHLDDNRDTQMETMTEMRVYVPPPEDENADPLDNVKAFNGLVVKKAEIGDSMDPTASFEGVLFTVPRGRYDVDLFPGFFKLHGKSFNYKIMFKSITKMFLCETPTQQHHVFIIGLHPPIRQGRSAYSYLIMQFQSDKVIDVSLNMEQKTLDEKYKGLLDKELQGPSHDIISRVFKALTGKKVIVPGKFVGSKGTPSVQCSFKAETGYLFVLSNSFFFIKKPPMHIRHDNITSVDFVGIGNNNRNTFEMRLTMRDGQELGFTSMDRPEYDYLVKYCVEKKLHVINIKEHQRRLARSGGEHHRRARDVDYSNDPYMQQLRAQGAMDDSDSDASGGGMMMGDEDSEDDEDFVAESQSDDYESDAGGGVSDVERNTDEEEDPEEAEARRKKAEKKRKRSESGSKKKSSAKKSKRTGPKPAKSAWVFFMSSERAKVQEANPDAGFADISKLVGVRWKQLSPEAKAPYEAQHAADVLRYKEEMANYEPTEEEKAAAAEKKAKTKKKSKKGPKRARSAYQFFMGGPAREEVKTENPTASSSDILKLVAAKWKELSEEDKAPYTAQSAEDKIRYAKEKEEFDIRQEERRKKKKAKKKKKKDKKKKKKEMKMKEEADAGGEEDGDDEGDDDSSGDEAAPETGEAGEESDNVEMEPDQGEPEAEPVVKEEAAAEAE